MVINDPTPRLVQVTRDPLNNALSLQLLRLYATSSAETSALLLVAGRCPLPTLHEFTQALIRMRN
jgi:hypothetical protein